jgi:hypothetical protein
MLRQMNELVDFSFVYDELKDNYCHDNGRNAIDPIQMFKYLLLKVIMIYRMPSRKVNPLKLRQKNGTRLKQRIVNSNTGTGMMWHYPRV